MRFLTDEQVLKNMRQKADEAKRSSKEGRGTGRGVGSAGLVGADWMRWCSEANRRGLLA